MKVVVNQNTREFLSSYHEAALLPHHEVVEVVDEDFNLAIRDCMRMGPHFTLDILAGGRMSIRQGGLTATQIAAQELKDYMATESPTREQMEKAIRNLIIMGGHA